MRFHVVSLPHTQTTEQYAACAFTEKVRKFCIMMKEILGHDVFLYAGEFNDAPCDEHIMCLTEAERSKAVGNRHFSQASFAWQTDQHWKDFNSRAAAAIKQRAQKDDFICVIGGLAHKPIADALPDMMTVEFGIGYGGVFAPYKVFESYAWMHTVYGSKHPGNPNAADGSFFDDVVPGYFEVEKFPYSEVKDDYYLFVGRMTQRKGIRIAEEACRAVGARLLIAGPPNDWVPNYGAYIGEISPYVRGPLMARARALFVPTEYIEPFGNVAVEAQACGTPVICTAWGAMTETVEHGKTGFHCRTLREFIEAMSHVKKLDYAYIRQRAIEIYSLAPTAKKYEKYFKRLSTVQKGKGWYDLSGLNVTP